jgi:hypothetical protein
LNDSVVGETVTIPGTGVAVGAGVGVGLPVGVAPGIGVEVGEAAVEGTAVGDGWVVGVVVGTPIGLDAGSGPEGDADPPPPPQAVRKTAAVPVRMKNERTA